MAPTWFADEPADAVLSHADELLRVARAAIEVRVQEQRALPIRLDEFALELQQPRACFVTLRKHRALRGCMGCLEPQQSLVESVAYYAVQSATNDPRFPPVQISEVSQLHISLSVLSPATPLPAESEGDLLQQLRPGVDGVTLIEGVRRATLLPQVWEHLSQPGEFLAHLKRKAGLTENYWSKSLYFERYRAVCVAEPLAADPDLEEPS